jgi:hypothetical protein
MLRHLSEREAVDILLMIKVLLAKQDISEGSYLISGSSLRRMVDTFYGSIGLFTVPP